MCGTVCVRVDIGMDLDLVRLEKKQKKTKNSLCVKQSLAHTKHFTLIINLKNSFQFYSVGEQPNGVLLPPSGEERGLNRLICVTLRLVKKRDTYLPFSLGSVSVNCDCTI